MSLVVKMRGRVWTLLLFCQKNTTQRPLQFYTTFYYCANLHSVHLCPAIYSFHLLIISPSSSKSFCVSVYLCISICLTLSLCTYVTITHSLYGSVSLTVNIFILLSVLCVFLSLSLSQYLCNSIFV